MTLNKKRFEIIVGKGENAGDQYLYLFPQYIQPYQRHSFPKAFSFYL